jgi:SAM-dependent methyltransferase
MFKYSMLSPLKPTWRRYLQVFWRNSGISIYRSLQYEALSRLEYRGRVLDFGGGERAHYYDVFRSWLADGVYESANIDSAMAPTYLVAPDGRLPVEAGSFDMVISINTLEHVYAIEQALDELLRVVKPGGRLVLSVPFLYRVHGCPDDFNRPTASWWRETLSRKGVAELEIAPLAWDGMTAGVAVVDGIAPFSRLRRVLVPLLGLLYVRVRGSGNGERYKESVGESLSYLALGYVISAVAAR